MEALKTNQTLKKFNISNNKIESKDEKNQSPYSITKKTKPISFNSLISESKDEKNQSHTSIIDNTKPISFSH